MEKVSQNILQIYENSKDTKTLMQNLKSNTFYIDDFLQQYEYVKDIGLGDQNNIVVKLYKEINGHKKYAVKSYDYHIQQHKSELLEFIIEAHTQEKIQNKVNCAYINNMKGFFLEQDDDDLIYLNMILEYGDGSLNQLINYYKKNKTQKLEFFQLIKIFQQQLTVLKICEENQITHRDIKPSHILYRKDFKNYTSQLADFGEVSKNGNLLQTKNTTVRGAPQYLSSELQYAHIKKKVEKDVYNPYKSDTYSLGLSILSLASCNNYFKINTDNMQDPLIYNSKDIGQENWEYLQSINAMFEQFLQKYQEQSSKDKQNLVFIIKMCLCYNPKYRIISSEILNQLNITFYDIQPLKYKFDGKIAEQDIEQNQKNFKIIEYKNGEKYEGEFKDENYHGQGTFYYQDGGKYEGEFKDNKVHGQGTLYYQNGEKYEGEFKDENYHGQGTFYYQDGEKYEGEFKDNKKHGQGTYYYQDGKKYEGEFKDDKIHGQGTLYYQNGEKYEGEFKDEKRHGQGTYYYQDGEKAYEGEFKDDKKYGQGTSYFQDGEKYEGVFKDDNYHGQGTYYYQNGRKYEGEFKDGNYHGQGTFYYQNGNKYEGEFKDDKRHGQGTYYYQDGRKYQGQFKDNKKHGQGTFYYQDGEKYEGEFKDNNLNGYGTYYYQNGCKYEGEFKDNKEHGQGIEYSQDGRKYEGEFKDGERHGQGTFYNQDQGEYQKPLLIMCFSESSMLAIQFSYFKVNCDVKRIFEKIGQNAVTQVQNNFENGKKLFSIIILDKELKHKNCLQILKELRQYEDQNNMKPALIVIMVKDLDTENQEDIKSQGADFVIEKPMSSLSINEAIDFLNNKQAQQ